MRKITRTEDKLRIDIGQKLHKVMTSQDKSSKVMEAVSKHLSPDPLHLFKIIEVQKKLIEDLFEMSLANARLKDYLTKKLERLDKKPSDKSPKRNLK